MSRVQRRNLFLTLILLVGLTLSFALSYSFQQWTNTRNQSRVDLESRAWAQRLSADLQSGTMQLSTIATVLSNLSLDEKEGLGRSRLHNAVVEQVLSGGVISSVAWVPEMNSANIFTLLAQFPELTLEEGRLTQELETAEHLYPVAWKAGPSSLYRIGMEVSREEHLSEPLEVALENAALTPVVLPADAVNKTNRLQLVQPVVLNQGVGLGVLLAELNLDALVGKTRGEGTQDLALELYENFPPQKGGVPLWSDPALESVRTNKAKTVVVPIQVADQRWSANVVTLEVPPAVSWESALAGIIGLMSTLSFLGYCRFLFARASENLALAEENASSLKAKEQAYQESLQNLARAEEKYRDLFEKSQALIWTQNEKGVISSLNPASANSLGYELSEMIDRPLREFIIPTERHTFSQFLETCKKPSSKGLLKLYTKNGATRFWMYQTSLSKEGGDSAVRCHALDVTESQQAERELERLSRRNELILESVGEGIYGINLAGECTFVNPAALKFTGHSREELMKAVHTMHEILQPHRPDGSDYPWEDSPAYATLNDGEIRRVTGETMWRKDGSSFPVDFVVTPIVEDDERILGAVVTFQDVTERRAIEQMKNEFISIVSHELRTPLTSIRGSLGLLGSGLLKKFPEKADKMLKIAVENTDRLVRLINDILDIERLESGKVTVELDEVNLGDLMTGASETMQAMAGDNGVKLTCKPLKDTVWADSDRILQVLTNLLSNAIKFSEKDSEVKLSAKAHKNEEGEEGKWIRVSVKDSGRGVPPDAVSKIFERFGQVDASDSREKGGTGLGLPICKTIVQQHGGRIWVDSKVGKGSTFNFLLPVDPPEGSSEEEGDS